MLVWSMRARLTLAMALILVLTLGGTFVAVYRGTGQELRGRIDRRLRDEAGAFALRGVPPGIPPAPALVAAGRRYIAVQPFSSSARLLFERVAGGGLATNQPELLRLTREFGEPVAVQHAENDQARRLLDAPTGYSTVELRDLGPLRLYVQPVNRGVRTVATIGLGEPLAPVQRAQDSIATTFAVAGSVALLFALLASYLIASRTLQPVRRMAGVAARVDAGDLSPRIGASGARDEVRVLADAFDHMLDRLEHAFDRQTSFLADVSHELRTPLTVLRGQLEVLARDPQFSREGFDRVERLAQAEILRMQKLVDDLLLIAHSEEPAFLRPERIEVNGYLRDLVDGARATADRRFELSCGIPGQLRADPDRLAQALRNLIVNATQHTGPGGLVRVTAEPLGDAVVLAVEDDGPGIPESEREAVFDRFHRTDGSRSRSLGGTGLGLAIVRAIVEAHHGHVAVEEAPGGGTRIVLFMPGFTATGNRTGTPVA
jgi:two-component system, OmpR family, sensor kinase